MEEKRFIDMLRMIGMDVTEIDHKTGLQFEFLSGDGHCLGHCDGVGVFKGVVYLLEFKTHGNKSFTALVKANDLVISKFEHYCQMQIYMSNTGIEHGLYCAVNKDNDNLYFEVIKSDKKIISWVKERETGILEARTPPVRISENSSFWVCNYCWYNAICFNREKPLRNCRTCDKSALGPKGSWLCGNKKEALTISEQLRGCKKHSYL